MEADSDVINDAGQHLRAAIGFKKLVDWNDPPGRTQAEVAALVDAAIAAAGPS